MYLIHNAENGKTRVYHDVLCIVRIYQIYDRRCISLTKYCESVSWQTYIINVFGYVLCVSKYGLCIVMYQQFIMTYIYKVYHETCEKDLKGVSKHVPAHVSQI